MAQKYALGFDIPPMLPCFVRNIPIEQEQGRGDAYLRHLLDGTPCKCLDAITSVITWYTRLYLSTAASYLHPYLYDICINEVPGPWVRYRKAVAAEAGHEAGF